MLEENLCLGKYKGICPDRESFQGPLGAWEDAQSTDLHQLGPGKVLWKVYHMLVRYTKKELINLFKYSSTIHSSFIYHHFLPNPMVI